MPSFQIAVKPNRRAAARFVGQVRRAIQKAFKEENKKTGITQSDIARALGIHRSVINRELKGFKDITLGRVAELAWALGRKPSFNLDAQIVAIGQNVQSAPAVVTATVTATVATTVSTSASIQPALYQTSARAV